MDKTNKELELLEVTMVSELSELMEERVSAPEDPASENICISCE